MNERATCRTEGCTRQAIFSPGLCVPCATRAGDRVGPPLDPKFTVPEKRRPRDRNPLAPAIDRALDRDHRLCSLDPCSDCR